MRFIYNIFIALYALAARLVALNSPKAKLWVKGRHGIITHIRSTLQPNEQRIWIHCPSLGEFEQGRPLIERIKQRNPEYKIVLTFYSPSGYEVRKNYPQADYIFYLPSDSVWQAKTFLEMVKPEMIFFVKYDYWFNYIHQAHKMGIPFYVISCIFRPQQIFFTFWGKWMLKQLREITRFYVQDETSLQLLQQHHIMQAEVVGDTRFDRVNDIIAQAKRIPAIEEFCNGEFTMVCGSTWLPDDILLARLYHKYPNMKLIIAPHETHEQRIYGLEKLYIDYKVARYTNIDNIDHLKDYNILIIDTIGLLSSIYYYADVAYVGGGFGRGIHNILEAATYGKPILFGPKYQKFKEAVDLIHAQGAYSINTYADIEKQYLQWRNEESTLKQAGEQAGQYVRTHTLATEKIYSSVFHN